jgi:CP family cyanate transporter-like MFS transporter
MMGVYTMALSGSAAVAAGSTVPIGALLGYGWRGALAAWAVPAVLALLAWLPYTRVRNPPPAAGPGGRALLRSALAWQVTLFFGLQALSFYAVLAWLPSVYRDHGYSPAAAGLLRRCRPSCRSRSRCCCRAWSPRCTTSGSWPPSPRC